MSQPLPIRPSLRAPSSSLVVVGGGVRSGKSRTALQMALARGTRRVFVATAEALDDEMRQRIARHQSERQGAFDTVEAPHDLATVASRLTPCEVVVVDCMTLYLSNRLLLAGDLDSASGETLRAVEERCLRDVRESIDALRRVADTVIVVTNEVGMGIVPVSRLGRVFRDIAGAANQWLAQQAQEVWWCALGIPLCLKPQPAALAPAVSVQRESPHG